MRETRGSRVVASGSTAFILGAASAAAAAAPLFSSTAPPSAAAAAAAAANPLSRYTSLRIRLFKLLIESFADICTVIIVTSLSSLGTTGASPSPPSGASGGGRRKVSTMAICRGGPGPRAGYPWYRGSVAIRIRSSVSSAVLCASIRFFDFCSSCGTTSFSATASSVRLQEPSLYSCSKMSSIEWGVIWRTICRPAMTVLVRMSFSLATCRAWMRAIRSAFSVIACASLFLIHSSSWNFSSRKPFAATSRLASSSSELSSHRACSMVFCTITSRMGITSLSKSNNSSTSSTCVPISTPTLAGM
mmetsp:Transcript_13980/g.30890  ORF Transcript_13980/g.30890 Transcript_13980/m.30890 type:complete len:303 (+) Transcript_13980:213-1121(+)